MSAMDRDPPLPNDRSQAPPESAEQTLARLAAAAGPLRRALAALAARILDTRAYEPLCYARLGDYARERAGLSARQLQDLAQVHRALARLPRLERALVGNDLPWSKVRLLARVASGADEEDWIARARELPIRKLEEEVQASASRGGAGGGEDPDETPSLAQVTVRCSPAVRARWLQAHEMAERVAGQRLRPGEALEWITAEVCSELPLAEPVDGAAGSDEQEEARPGAAREDAERSFSDEDAAAACAATERAPAPPLPAAIASLTDRLADADPFELDRRLRRAVALEQRLDAAIAPLLRVVTASEYEWSRLWQPLAVYAAEQLGMSASKARALLRIERAGDVCPELRDAFRSGRLSWAKAQGLVPLLLLDVPGPWRPRWVAWAERVTVRRLEADVARALLLRAAHGPAWHRCLLDPERAQHPIPAAEQQMCAPEIDLEATERLTWRVPRDVEGLFVAVRETLRVRLRGEGRRLPSDGEVLDALLARALASWSRRAPGAPRPDPVIERDGYRCTVPGCSSRRHLHDHHVRFRSAGGSDDPANRITLCAFHHQRCLHAGRLRIRGRAPAGLLFELGVRPGGAEPIARYRSGDVVAALPGVGRAGPARRRFPLSARP
jgi:hypothetical protein